MQELTKPVTEKKGQAITTSRMVADIFSKRHDVVLRTIENIECSDEFRKHNFVVSSYRQGKGKYKEYILTRDGFSFIAMGFTGKKAAQFKEAYINEFNRMEDFIKSLQTAKLEFPAFTNTIMAAHEEPKHYHFSNEINMINKIVLGMAASQFKEKQGIDKKVASIRPYLTAEQIKAIEALQRVDIGLIVAVPSFQERREHLTRYYYNTLIKSLSA